MIHKSFKYRIYPSKAQEQQLAQFFGSVRWIYNWALAKKKEAWDSEKKKISFIDLCDELPKLKKQEETKWLANAFAQGLQCSLKNLDQAYKNFFNGTSKYPRFKSRKKNHQSCQFPQRVEADFENSMFFIPNLDKLNLGCLKELENLKAKLKLLQFRKLLLEITLQVCLLKWKENFLLNLKFLKVLQLALT